jgi:hypothetical protein
MMLWQMQERALTHLQIRFPYTIADAVADARESLKRAVCKREPYVMLWQKQERALREL